MIRIFLGYDQQEPVAYHVAAHSLLRQSSEPLALAPVALSQLHGILNRERDPKQSTDFSFGRFLVPWLANFEGWAIFMDGDVLALDDVAALWALRDDRYAVMVVKHDHVPVESTKFLGQEQSRYEKKNWSSVMLVNAGRCRALSPDYVNTASGLDLHRFQWLENDDLIGELPPRWNHLVDYDPPLPPEELSLLHFTSGGPWFSGYEACGYAELWRAEYGRLSLPLEPPGEARLRYFGPSRRQTHRD